MKPELEAKLDAAYTVHRLAQAADRTASWSTSPAARSWTSRRWSRH